MVDVHEFEPGKIYKFVVKPNALGNEFDGTYWIYQFERREGRNYLFRLLEMGYNDHVESFPDRPLRQRSRHTLSLYKITEVLPPGVTVPAAGGKRKTTKSRRKRNNKKKNKNSRRSKKIL
jgi:hypothetical protein